MGKISTDALGSVFTDALIEVIAKTSGFSLEVLSAEQNAGFDENTAIMKLCGNNSVMVFISAEEASMRILCSYIEGIPQNEITQEDINDVLSELVNMTAGSAKLLLNDTDYMFTLSSPFLISGKDMSITTKKRVTVISRTIGNEEIKIRLKIIL